MMDSLAEMHLLLREGGWEPDLDSYMGCWWWRRSVCKIMTWRSPQSPLHGLDVDRLLYGSSTIRPGLGYWRSVAQVFWNVGTKELMLAQQMGEAQTSPEALKQWIDAQESVLMRNALPMTHDAMIGEKIKRATYFHQSEISQERAQDTLTYMVRKDRKAGRALPR